MRKLIWLPVAGFLLIAGAAVAAATPGVVSRAQAILPVAASSPDPNAQPGAVVTDGKDGLLSEVLADLVANNTITQAQADAITAALQTRIADKRAELEALRAKCQEFIADGVITQAEIDQLPADNPLRQAWDSIATDGQVTLDQLHMLHPFGFGLGHHGAFGPGPGHHGGFDWAPDANEEVPDATPTPGS